MLFDSLQQGLIRGHEDLDLGLLVRAGEGAEAVFQDVVQQDLLGDVARDLQLARGQKRDHVFKVVALVADGADDVLFGKNKGVRVHRDVAGPDGGDDFVAVRLDAVSQQVEALLGRGGLEGHVRAGAVCQFLNLGYDIIHVRIENDVGTGVQGVLLTHGFSLNGNDLSRAEGFQGSDGGKTDGARAGNDGGLTGLEVAGSQGVVADGKGLYDGAVFKGHVVGHMMNEFLGEIAILGKTAIVRDKAKEA